MPRKTIAGILAILALPAAIYLYFVLRAPKSSRASGLAILEKKWEFQLGSLSNGALALTPDGTIIAAAEDGYVYAIDSNGKLQWKTYIGATEATPTIGPDGAIYVANNNGSVFALNSSGSQRWQSLIYNGNTYGHSSAAIGKSFLYQPSRDALYAVSLSDGRVEWSIGPGTEQWGSVTLLADGTILFSGHGRLNAIDSNGYALWKYPPLTQEAVARNGGFPPPAEFHVVSSIVPGPHRQLYVTVGRSQFADIGLDGTLRWQFDSLGNQLHLASPLISTDGTIYFLNSAGRLNAFDSVGTKKWTTILGDTAAASPLLAADGTIFAIGASNIFAVSPAGEILAKVTAGNNVTSSPTLAPDGTLYVANQVGLLMAFAGGHGPLMDSPWPKFQADLANTGNAR